MNTTEARKLALQLMTEHGLIKEGWEFDFDRSKRRFGICRYGTKKICLSIYLVELNTKETVRDTILHEIAHALVGTKQGHNQVWKNKALEIGCSNKRCYGEHVIVPAGKYEANCPRCSRKFVRYKAPKLYQSCGYCSGNTYNHKFFLYWTKQE